MASPNADEAAKTPEAPAAPADNVNVDGPPDEKIIHGPSTAGGTLFPALAITAVCGGFAGAKKFSGMMIFYSLYGLVRVEHFGEVSCPQEGGRERPKVLKKAII